MFIFGRSIIAHGPRRNYGSKHSLERIISRNLIIRTKVMAVERCSTTVVCRTVVIRGGTTTPRVWAMEFQSMAAKVKQK